MDVSGGYRISMICLAVSTRCRRVSGGQTIVSAIPIIAFCTALPADSHAIMNYLSGGSAGFCRDCELLPARLAGLSDCHRQMSPPFPPQFPPPRTDDRIANELINI